MAHRILAENSGTREYFGHAFRQIVVDGVGDTLFYRAVDAPALFVRRVIRADGDELMLLRIELRLVEREWRSAGPEVEIAA